MYSLSFVKPRLKVMMIMIMGHECERAQFEMGLVGGGGEKERKIY
jgi:hypothetical protein